MPLLKNEPTPSGPPQDFSASEIRSASGDGETGERAKDIGPHNRPTISNNVDNTTMTFHGPQFIVGSDGKLLDLSIVLDKMSVTTNSFHGSPSQQWLVEDAGNGEVALLSQYNGIYVAPNNGAEDAQLVSANNPFYWKIFHGDRGYKLVVPNTDLSLIVGCTARLCPLSDAKGAPLFLLENTPENLDVIKRGYFVPRSSKTGQFKASVGNESNTGVNLNPDSFHHNTNTTIPDTSGNKLEPKDPKPATLVISERSPVPTASTGNADIIGFGTSGVSILLLRSRLNPQKQNVLTNFGYDSGWRVEKHVRLLADTTGNGRTDIVGFGEFAVWVSRNNDDNTFQAPENVIADFAYANGWRVEKHPRFMADIRNTGRADIVGFGDAGVLMSFNNGDGSFSPARLALAEFGYNTGWRVEKHLRFLADVNGNGLLDIVGFGESTVWVANNNGDGTFQPVRAVVQDLCYSSGWRIEKHPRFVADLTGDGKPDLIGFGDAGVYAAFNNGDGTFQSVRKVYDDFCYNVGGWRVESHLRFIADVTGNGCGDIIGFGGNGVSVAINNGNGTFQTARLVSMTFGISSGWRVEKHPRFVVDLTGDGPADIVGFGERAAYAIYNDGKGNFGPETVLINDFGCQGGEWLPERSVRYVANLHH